MALKVRPEELENLRRNGASVRKFSREQLNSFRESASGNGRVMILESEAQPAPPVDMQQLARVVHDVVRHTLSQAPARKAPTYHFEIKRNEKGFIDTITAHPDD